MDSLVADKSHGNVETVAFLERALERARKGDVGYAAIAFGIPPNQCGVNYCGDLRLEPFVIDGLGKLKETLQSSVDSWNLPATDETLDESYVRYNGVLGPLGFDFINWLVDAYMDMKKAGIDGPLNVHLWRGKHELKGDDRGHIWVNNVFSPIVELFEDIIEDRSTEPGHACYGRHTAFYSLKHAVNKYKEGIQLPKMKTPGPFKYEKGSYVTITLRETTKFLWRNANIPVWAKFARWLTEQGEHVIVIRDTMKADSPLAEFEICPEASKNIADRYKAYGNAKCNLGVGNGPMELCWLGGFPLIDYQLSQENNPQKEISQTEAGWKHGHGFYGENFPWFNDKQILVWRQPTFELMQRTWNEWSNK